MKDDQDRYTGTLEGIEPEPVKLTQAQSKSRQRYQGPKDRTRCQTCRHMDTEYHQADTLMQFERHWCKLGGFRVMLGGSCLKHDPKKGTATA